MPLDPKVIRDIYGEQEPLFNPFPTAKDYNPDQVAEGLKIGRAKGLDGLLATENLPQLKDELDQDHWNSIVQKTPKLARQLQQPAFAAVAQDDTENLGIIDSLVKFGKDLGGDVSAGFHGSSEGYYGFIQGAAEVGASAIDPLVGTLLPENPLGRMAEASREQRQFEKSKVSAVEKARGPMGSTESAFHSGVQSAVQSLLTLPLAILSRNPEVLAGTMAAQTTGQAYGDARDQGKTIGEALPFAASQGYIEYATEQIPAIKLLDGLKTKAPIMQIAKDFLAREIPGEQVATALQDLNEWAVLNPDKPFASYLAERPEAAYQTAVATLVGGSIQVGTAKAMDTIASKFAGQEQHATDAQQHREVLAQLDQMVSESKVRARDPETFKQYVAKAVEDGPVSDVYIDAQALAQAGPNVLNQMPATVQEQYTEALASGGSVQIPLEEFLTHVAGTEASQAVIDHVKLDPNGMTFAESEQFQATYQAEFNNQVAQATEEAQGDENFKASAAEVKDLVKTQLNDVGHTSPNVNDTYSTMASSYYAVRAAQMGITPRELFDRYPLKVTGERITGGLDQSNAQIETPQFKEWFGDSKVVDKGGQPRVLYHGTTANFETFDPKMSDTQAKTGAPEGTFFFTDTPAIAESYTVDYAGDWTTTYKDGGKIMPSYVSLKNPKIIDAKFDHWNEIKYKGNFVTINDIAADVKSQGKYDGVIVRNVKDYGKRITGVSGGGDTIIAFSPTQIKSAIGNNGNFDPNDPNILNQSAIGATGTNPDDFITINGNLNFAEISGALSEEIKRQAGVIRLNVGENTKDNKGYGKKHIEARHAAQIKGAGFPNVESFIAHILGNTTEIWQASAGQLLFIAKDAQQKVMYLRLQPAVDKDGDYYRINSALPVRQEDYAERKGMKLLWKGSEPASIVPGKQSEFAATSDKTSQTDPNAYSQSENSIGQNPVKVNTPLNQTNRGAYSPNENTIALLKNADLSTFLHELGHAFLTMDTQLVNDILTKPEITDQDQQILDDVKTLFDWFGLEGALLTQLTTWNAMSVDEQRAHHEKFAEGFEAYLFEGKAPSLELQPLFQRFRAWLANVYRNLSAYLKDAGETLTPEVTAVFDRMLATTDQIKLANQTRNMAPMFKTAEEAGMDQAQFAEYQQGISQASQDAIATLEAKSLRDMTWTSNLRARTVERLNKQAAGLRREVRMQARAEVLQEPVYKAWQFLTARLTSDDKLKKPPSNKNGDLDPSRDSLLEAIAKLGGLNKKAAISEIGVDPKDKSDAGIFGKPVWRAEGGLTLDGMAEQLAQYGYLSEDENGKYDLREFEEKLQNELRGEPEYSYAYDYAAARSLPFSDLNLEALQGGRLERADVVRILGEKEAAKLDKRRMLRTVGLPADVAAEMFGYESGEAMVKALSEATPPSKEIEALTDQKMLEQHGELSTPEAISKAADAAIHNDVRTRILATELAGLQKALGGVRMLTRMAKEYANAVVGKTKVKDLRPNKFAADAAKAGKQADQALRKGNRDEAITQKRNQLVNHATTKVAYEAQAEVTKIAQRFRKIVSAKNDNLKGTHNLDLVNATRAILAEYGIGTRGQSPREYLELVKAYDPELFATLEPEITQAERDAKEIRDLSIDELRALRDQVESLWFLARREKQVEIDGKMVDRDKVVNDLVDRLNALGLPTEIPGQTHAATEKDKAARTLRGFRAALRRVEAWVDRMDSGEIKGVFRKYLFTPISEAADLYRIDAAEMIKKYRDLLNTIAPTMRPGRIAAPELNYTFGYSKGDAGMSELLHAILHTGNESNKRKLLLGRGWAVDNNGVLDTSAWDTFVNRLIQEGTITKAHFDFAQGVWDLLEETKPLAQKTHREVFGRYFAEVTADSFTNQFGTYRGGYVPALTDTFEVQDAAINQALEDVNAGNAYMFPATSRGFTKSRVEYNKPLALDLRLIPQHIDKVLLFAHMERHVRDVQRILKRAQGTLNVYDPVAYTDMLLPWLNRAARQIVQTPSTGSAGRAADNFFRTVRSRAGMSTMFANLTNALQQITGFSLTALKVKPSLLGEAMAQYMKAPKELANAAAELSPFMAVRLEHQAFQLRSEIEDIILNPSKFDQVKNWTNKHAYFLQSAFQNTVDVVSWTGAYNQALGKGETEMDAVRFANSVIRETQGSLQPEDISRFEAGTAFTRLFTQFASYFNMQANVLGSEFATVAQEMGLRKGAGKAFYIMLFGFLAPAWISEAIVQGMRGGNDDGDDEYLDEWFSFFFGAPLRNASAMIPIAGPLANRAAAGFTPQRYDDRMSTAPAISVIESAVNAPSSMYEALVEGGRAKPAIRDALSAITMVTGIPVSPLAKPLGYATDVAQGNVEPTSGGDLARGLVTGVASPESKR